MRWWSIFRRRELGPRGERTRTTVATTTTGRRRKTQDCIIEAMRFHGPSVVNYDIIIDRQRTPIIGMYLPGAPTGLG